MARPGLEPVRTASPVTGMDAFTAGLWRDPDSNRGHHDFQGVDSPSGRREKACN
jgi:hypothetical protein